MPIVETFLTRVAATLTAGIIKAAGVRFGKSLAKREVEKALERCGEAAMKALVQAGLPAGSEALREHLEDALGSFAKSEEVHDVLARALREGSLPPDEAAVLREAFQEEHPSEVLPGFDVELAVAAFVTAFVDQAVEEEAFQGLIQTQELRKQTQYLRDHLEVAREQLEVQTDIRDRMPDPRGAEAAARRRYLERLRDECLMLPVTRLLGDEGLDRPLSLDQVYIELDTKTPKERPGETPEGRGRGPGMMQEERLSALEAFAGNDCLVLLGAAGSGKSTFAKEVLARLADASLGEGTEPPAGLSRDLVPVVIVLRELSSRLQSLELDDLSGKKRTRTLAESVREQALADLADEYRAPGFANGLTEAFEQGRCVLALDGLDEVPADLRGKVREAVLAARDQFHPVKVLVTCRVLSYGADFSLPGFASHELAPLDEEKILGFCRAWYRAQADLGRVEEATAAAKGGHLAQQVRQPPLDELAGNPLLLTTMAIIHTREKELPEGRAQVYESAIKLLVREWQKEKVGKRLVESETLQGLLSNDSRLWPLLQRVAYEAHRVGGTVKEKAAGLPKGDLWTLLSAPEHLGSAALAEEFLSYADQRAGLLVGLGGKPGHPAAFGFVHRTFQEYLAGRYLTRGRRPVESLYAHAADGDLWALAVELGAEALLHVDHNPQALLDLAFGLARADPRDTEQWRRAVLWGAKMAALAGAEAVDRDRGGAVDGAVFLEELRPKLVALLGSDLLPVERAEAGRALARLGEPREEVLTVDALELCRVPAGMFVMGRPEGEDAAWDREHPQHELDVAYDFWLSRYPVTQAQFREFLDAAGYGEARFWPEAVKHGRWENGRVKGWRDEEPRSEPERYGEPWDLGNHPAVGVTWYEALAFCRWLTERWRARGWLPEGWQVRLPSEPEWEKAARGGLEVLAGPDRGRMGDGWAGGEVPAPELTPNPASQRGYPWQGDFSADLANSAASGVGTSSAAGCFPGGTSPYGCEEMAGNVWEWTRSVWGEYPYPEEASERAAREDLASEEDRVLRGGAFDNAAAGARCSARGGGGPGGRGGIIGFRVLVSPFSSDL